MTSIVLTRRRILALSAGVFLLLAGLVFQPLVVHFAESAAEQRGWSVTIRHASLGARGVWLKSIRLSRKNVPGFDVKLDAILVPWRNSLARDGLVIVGGNVLLPQNLESLQEDISEREQAKSSSHSGVSIRVSGIDVRFPAAAPSGTSVFAWGISGAALAGKAEFRADRLEVSRDQSAGVIAGIVFSAERSNGAWKLLRAKCDKAGLTIQNHDTKSSSMASAVVVDTRKTAKKKGQDPQIAKESESGDVIQRLSQSMAGIKEGFSGIRGAVARHLGAGATVEIPSISLRLSLGDQSLNVGPFQLEARNESEQLTIAIVQGSMGTDDRRTFEVHVPHTPSRVEVRSEVGFVSLQTLGVKEADFGLAHVDSAKLRLNLAGTIDEVASKALLTASGELLDVSLNQRWLASRTVSGINAEFSGQGEIGWDAGFSMRLSNLSLKLGQARVDVTADLWRMGDETRAKVDVNVPLAACGALIDSLPSGLAPLASQVKLEGTLALQAGIVFDTQHPNKTDAKWDLANGCRVRGSSLQVAPERFREPFILEVPDAHGVMVERAFGPGTPNWVPLSAMNAHLADAILVCEDGRFFTHNGFDPQAIRASIKDNVLRGKFMRGGSTVSMQLAKNLYLRREKTVSRKLQEAVLTLLLEQSFSKNDLLELYWNVVELGPGVYGVGEASKFYFGTNPADLSTTQAFYLASILPNPKALHFAPDGTVFRGWLNQVRRLLTIAHSRHYLTDEELHQSLDEDLHFGSSVGNHPPAASLSSEIEDSPVDVPTDG